jgi:recombination protein RecA
MSAARDVEALLARIGTRIGVSNAVTLARGLAPFSSEDEAPRPLEVAWPGLRDVLPDGGLPRGVVELAAARALGGATSLALAAVRAGQERGPKAWCAWIDPEATLHAPGVVAAGVDLARMLVVRPPRPELGRVAVKVAASGAFEVIVVDVDAVPGARPADKRSSPNGKPGRAPPNDAQVLVRKLALKAEETGATVVLLTDSTRPRAVPWPVALRLELSRPSRHELTVRVAKERRGRIGLVKTVPFQPAMGPTVSFVRCLSRSPRARAAE